MIIVVFLQINLHKCALDFSSNWFKFIYTFEENIHYNKYQELYFFCFNHWFFFTFYIPGVKKHLAKESN